MFRYSLSKTKLCYNYCNIDGIDTSLKITKQGRCISATLQQKFVTRLYRDGLYYLGTEAIIVFICLFLLNNADLIIYFTAIVFFVFVYEVFTKVYQESLIMVCSLGYQITSKSIIRESNQFIPLNKVQSIFINEVIIRHRVIYLLTILTKEGEDDLRLIPLFIELQPCVKHLELILKQLKGINS